MLWSSPGERSEPAKPEDLRKGRPVSPCERRSAHSRDVEFTDIEQLEFDL
ncbi:hypothetical protein GCM10010335_18800 [Streptomyces galbus]|nr:hypothetical protein GCM10010335_18800 [Streptomyces galbus]